MTSLSAAPFAALYSDALSSVFGFLPLADLAAVAAVCAHWNAAVSTMASIGASIIEPSHRIYTLCASSLSRQIRSLGVSAIAGRFDFDATPFTGSCHTLASSRLEFDPDTLAICATAMTDLRAMHGRMVLPQRDPFVFPPRLTLLRVHLLLQSMEQTQDLVDQQASAFIEAIAALKDLVDLSLLVEGPRASKVSLAPLANMAQLRSLTLGVPWVPEWRSLRTLTQLDALRLRNAHVVLADLLAPPHHLPWRDLGPLMLRSNELTAALTSLPLTSLDVVLSDQATSVDFLSRLSTLRSLALDLRDLFRSQAQGQARELMRTLPAALESALVALPGLTALEVCNSVLDVDQTTRVLQSLPSLTSLSFLSCFFGFWRFLLVSSLQSKLCTLKLRGCDGGTEADLKHLHGLRALTALDLSDSAPLTAAAAPRYTVPSSLMPGLRRFVFRLPRIRAPPPPPPRKHSSDDDSDAEPEEDEEAGIAWEPIA